MQKRRFRGFRRREMIPGVLPREEWIGAIRFEYVPRDFGIVNRHHRHQRAFRCPETVVFDFDAAMIIITLRQRRQFGEDRQRFLRGTVCGIHAIVEDVVLDERLLDGT